MLFKSAFKSSWICHVLFSMLFMAVIFGIYQLGWSFVVPVTDQGGVVERCTSDFGPRVFANSPYHKGVDIANAVNPGCDEIRNIYEELATIIVVEANSTVPSTGNYAKTQKTGGLFVRYLHMANSCPNSTDPNRWQCLENQTLTEPGKEDVTADIIVKYSNGTLSKVWAQSSYAGKSYNKEKINLFKDNRGFKIPLGEHGSELSEHLL